MDITGRSCILITSESLTAKEPLAYRDLFFSEGPSYKKNANETSKHLPSLGQKKINHNSYSTV